MESEGYTKLASLMGAYPEVAILRRFGTLNAQNLLYLQAELTSLELKLKRCVKADAESGHQDRRIYDRDWQTLSESIESLEKNGDQWSTVLQIRKTLKEYNKAMLLQSSIANFQTPTRKDISWLQEWMRIPAFGNVYLLGPDSDIWEKPDLSDLVSLKHREPHNPVALFIREFVMGRYHWLIGHRLRKPDGTKADTVSYSHITVSYLSTLLGTIVASVLPVASTVILYSIENMRWRLGVVGIFTALFSAALGIFTNGRVIEIFAATASFAAVQVVFIGTTSTDRLA